MGHFEETVISGNSKEMHEGRKRVRTIQKDNIKLQLVKDLPGCSNSQARHIY